ncbi:MAG: RNA polymerase sigma factor [Archangiaceae bacterium]|nr:RNA polymerase sigma factor [Archangiaceae bacterium]
MSDGGAEALFRAAYTEHLGWMLNTVRRLGVRPADIEDVAHDVFSTAWKRLDTYSRERAMRPWLFGIAFRVVSNRKANRSGQEQLEAEIDDARGEAHRPDELLEAEVTRRQVLAALDALPVDQRAMFVGADIEMTPITELAETLEIPLNTAYSRLRLGRQRFEAAFTKLRQEVKR